MDYLTADTLPWLHRHQQRLRESAALGRLPHSSLMLSPPGLGALHLANWMAALALCDSRALRPCGVCASCELLRSQTHPDYHVVRREVDAKQIKVEQVRELIGALSLTSYRGGFKVGIIEGAEALNASGANAMLKTLEEPSGDTLLILIALPAHRLPATIASRCMRVALRAPPVEEAVSWLNAQGSPRQQWHAALALAGGAPLLAVELAPEIAALDASMQESMQALAAGQVDVTLLAEQWVKSNPGMRLVWLENWITRRVRSCLGEAVAAQSTEPVRLSGALLKPKMRALFDLLDGTRELKRFASTNLNQQLALEALLLAGRTGLAD